MEHPTGRANRLVRAIRYISIASAAFPWPAVAQESGHRSRSAFGSLYVAKWADTTLPELPVKALTARLDFDRPALVAMGFNQVLIGDLAFRVPGTGLRIRKNSLELEAQLVKHFSGQDHVEAILAAVIRSGELKLFNEISANLAIANGISYAFSRPKYELGPEGQRGQGSRHLQYYLGVEGELSPSRTSKLHFLLKLHHRSGIYGLISPQKTGSNFLGGGVRLDID